MKMRPNSALAVAALILGLASSPLLHAADTVAQVQALVNQGQHSQALTMADRLLASNARDPQARFLKGIALTELNRPDEAIAVFQKLTEDFPELPEPYNNLAVLYAQQRQYDKARSALEMAIRTHPSYATAHENLGDVYARLASQAYNKALQLDSANTAAQSKLALIREMMSGTSQGGVKARTTGTNPQQQARTSLPPSAPAPAQVAAVTAPTVAAQPIPPTPAAATQPAAVTTSAAVPTQQEAPSAATHTAAKDAAAKPSGAEREAVQAVEAWARAWSHKDVKSYLSFYDKEFRTPGGISRQSWEQEREQRVGKPGRIAVDIDNPVARIDGDVATVRFRQNYESAGFNSSTTKTLELVRRNGTWRIRQERVGG